MTALDGVREMIITCLIINPFIKVAVIYLTSIKLISDTVYPFFWFFGNHFCIPIAFLAVVTDETVKISIQLSRHFLCFGKVVEVDRSREFSFTKTASLYLVIVLLTDTLVKLTEVLKGVVSSRLGVVVPLDHKFKEDAALFDLKIWRYAGNQGELVQLGHCFAMWLSKDYRSTYWHE